MHESNKQNAPVIIHTSSVVVPAADSTVKSHDCCHSSVNLFSGLFLISLDVPGGVGANVDMLKSSLAWKEQDTFAPYPLRHQTR